MNTFADLHPELESIVDTKHVLKDFAEQKVWFSAAIIMRYTVSKSRLKAVLDAELTLDEYQKIVKELNL